MRALTWQGNEQVEVADVPDPVIQEPNDIVAPGHRWARQRLGRAAHAGQTAREEVLLVVCGDDDADGV